MDTSSIRPTEPEFLQVPEERLLRAVVTVGRSAAPVSFVSAGVNVFIKPSPNPLSQAKNMQGFIFFFVYEDFIPGKVAFASNRCTWCPSVFCFFFFFFVNVLATFI